MPRINVYVGDKTNQKLRAYIKRNYPGKQIMSAIVDRAINEFLSRQEEPIKQ